MPFEQNQLNEYHELDSSTQYRFAEIEMSYAVRTLQNLFKNNSNNRQTAVSVMYNALVPNSMRIGEFEDRFYQVMNTTYFNTPPKEQIIHYLIMKGHSYQKIRGITSASFNTISKMRFGLPHYEPIFNMWNDTMLHNWNDIKTTLNIFNEELMHTK